MRAITNKILVAASMLLGLQAAVQASPILTVINGALMGAEGIDYNGHQYDVTFSDIRPTVGSLAFNTLAGAYGASDALDRLIFQGTYDMSPGTTNGCTSSLKCLVVTAYDIGFVGINGVAFTNTATQYIDPILPYLVLGQSANQPTITYAHWSPHQVRQAVPEPSTLLLTGGGMALMLMRRRRNGKTKTKA